MAFTVNNFVINRADRGMMFHSSTDALLWEVNQVTDPSLSLTSESVDALDALGNKIVTFDRSKNAEFSASNALFDMRLAAAQFGTTVSTSSASNKFNVPCFEIFTVPDSGTTVTLSHTPAGSGATGIGFIYSLNTDSTANVAYAYAASAAADKFSYTTTTLSYPTSLTAGDRFLVKYYHEASATENAGAVSVSNSATNFPTAGKFILRVIGTNVCDPSTEYAAYIIFPNAKLMSDVDLSFTTDGKHPFRLQCMQNYCDTTKSLFELVIIEDD